MKETTGIIVWTNRIWLLVIVLFLFYVLIFFPNMSLSYSSNEFSKTISGMQMSHEARAVVDNFIKRVGYSEMARTSNGTAVFLFTLIALMISIANVVMISRLKRRYNQNAREGR